MKYTIHARNNETGKETTYEGDKIICAAMHEEDEGETMAAEGQIDVSVRDFASWLASSDFYDDLLQQLILHTVCKTLQREEVKPLPGDGTWTLRHEGSDAMN